MAQINLGSIKFNWKGAYNNSTAYAVDDVVSSGGNSYVCIQASTGNAVGNATAYWNIMSAAGTNGTNGTDLSSTLSTRGDLVFKNASALARLPKGTEGQVLGQGANDPAWVNGSAKTLTTRGDLLYRNASTIARLPKGSAGQFLKQGANDPEWGAISPAAIVSVGYANYGTRVVLSDSTNSGVVFTVSFAKTLSASASKIIVHGQITFKGASGDFQGSYFDCQTSGVTCHETNDSNAFKGIIKSAAPSASTPGTLNILQQWQDTTHLGAATHTFEYGWRARNGVSGKPFNTLNPTASDDSRIHALLSTFVFYEVLI